MFSKQQRSQLIPIPPTSVYKFERKLYPLNDIDSFLELTFH